MKSEKLLEALNYVDEDCLAKADLPFKKGLHLKKRAITLIAAVICISLLAATAIAQLPSVFQYMKKMDPKDSALYEAAEEANLGKDPESVALPQMKEASLMIKQKYYDGQTVLMGLDVHAVEGDPAIGFEPDEKLMKHIRVRGYVPDAWVPPDAYDTIPYPRYARSMAKALREKVSPEQYQAFEAQMEKTGHCCIVFQNAFIGDHILINGIDVMPAFVQETPAGLAIRMDPLPEEALNQDRVTVTLKVKSSYTYWYLDTEGHAYEAFQPHQSQTVEIIIEKSEESKEGL